MNDVYLVYIFLIVYQGSGTLDAKNEMGVWYFYIPVSKVVIRFTYLTNVSSKHVYRLWQIETIRRYKCLMGVWESRNVIT